MYMDRYVYAYINMYMCIYIYGYGYIDIYRELSVHSHLIWLPYLICMNSASYMTYQLPKCCIIFGVLKDLITNFELLETKTLN